MIGLSISPLAGAADAEACARLMAQSEPWLTLGRSYETSLRIVRDPTREVYVARDELGMAGFLILCLVGPFVGYIQTVAVQPDRRGQGLGTELIRFAERRILEEFRNVFMCVSSFNLNARRLYAKLGYAEIGELADYIVHGHSEILLRKTTGPLSPAGPLS
jgi:[ribosomal protein S18]-alanine N-acetyltransferase